MLAAIGKAQDARRGASVQVLFNVLGPVTWLPFIAQLAGLAETVAPVAAHLHGVERLAEQVPRRIANAATICRNRTCEARAGCVITRRSRLTPVAIDCGAIRARPPAQRPAASAR